jgi:hypothetical protein
VYAFEGIPSESASTELLVPLFRAEQRAASDPASARIDTGIGVFNPGTTTANARIEYSGADHPAASPACRAQRFTSPTIAIPAHASHVFYQGNPSSEGLPAGCFGSARVVADSPVMAIVNEAINLGEKAAAYNAVSRPAGSRRLALPLWRRNHAGGLSTGISVMNAGTSAAHVAVAFSRALPAGSTEAVVCPAGCALELEPLEMGVLWPPLIDALPDNAYGSAVIESTQPVVAIVNDVAFSAVDMATYNAIALPAGAR